MNNDPVTRGLQQNILRIPIKQPVFHGKYQAVCFSTVAQLREKAGVPLPFEQKAHVSFFACMCATWRIIPLSK